MINIVQPTYFPLLSADPVTGLGFLFTNQAILGTLQGMGQQIGIDDAKTTVWSYGIGTGIINPSGFTRTPSVEEPVFTVSSQFDGEEPWSVVTDYTTFPITIRASKLTSYYPIAYAIPHPTIAYGSNTDVILGNQIGSEVEAGVQMLYTAAQYRSDLLGNPGGSTPFNGVNVITKYNSSTNALEWKSAIDVDVSTAEFGLGSSITADNTYIFPTAGTTVVVAVAGSERTEPYGFFTLTKSTGNLIKRTVLVDTTDPTNYPFVRTNNTSVNFGLPGSLVNSDIVYLIANQEGAFFVLAVNIVSDTILWEKELSSVPSPNPATLSEPIPLGGNPISILIHVSVPTNIVLLTINTPTTDGLGVYGYVSTVGLNPITGAVILPPRTWYAPSPGQFGAAVITPITITTDDSGNPFLSAYMNLPDSSAYPFGLAIIPINTPFDPPNRIAVDLAGATPNTYTPWTLTDRTRFVLETRPAVRITPTFLSGVEYVGEAAQSDFGIYTPTNPVNELVSSALTHPPYNADVIQIIP